MKMWDELVYRVTVAPRLKRLKQLLPEAIIFPAGSRYVCSPPELTTDIDFLVYVADDLVAAYQKLLNTGYRKSDYRDYFGEESGDFTAWRKGKVNLIVTPSIKYALAYHTATYICKCENVQIKYDRVLIHEWLRGTLHLKDELDPLSSWVHWSKYRNLFEAVSSPHWHALHMAYRAQHGLTEQFK